MRLLKRGESGPPCGVPSSTGRTKPSSITPAVKKCPDEFEHAFVGYPRGDAGHQAIVINSIEKLFEVEINHDVIALGNVTLRLGHRLMGRAPGRNP